MNFNDFCGLFLVYDCIGVTTNVCMFWIITFFTYDLTGYKSLVQKRQGVGVRPAIAV